MYVLLERYKYNLLFSNVQFIFITITEYNCLQRITMLYGIFVYTLYSLRQLVKQYFI